MTPRERMEVAKAEFRAWWRAEWARFSKVEYPEELADVVFDNVTWVIAEAERKYGNTGAAPRE